MAVTNRSKTKPLAGLTGFGLALVISFQNCAVDVSEETPGAAGACDPTIAQLSEFNTAATTILQNGTMCGACHLTTSGNPAAARMGLLPGTDDASQATNFCAVVNKAGDFLDGYLINRHPGGQYNNADVQALIDWAQTL